MIIGVLPSFLNEIKSGQTFQCFKSFLTVSAAVSFLNLAMGYDFQPKNDNIVNTFPHEPPAINFGSSFVDPLNIKSRAIIPEPIIMAYFYNYKYI